MTQKKGSKIDQGMGGSGNFYHKNLVSFRVFGGTTMI